MMDKSRAIKLLKQALGKVTHLKTLTLGNQEFELWRKEVLDILEVAFSKNSSEYERFARALRSSRSAYTDTERREEYNRRLGEYETALKSIIRKYEILGIEEKPNELIEPPKAFISHGKESAALRKLKEFLETLGIEPIIVIKQASLNKDVPDKIDFYLSQADFIIILATGDDEFEGKLHPRQNVIHEIGLVQKTHPCRIIYLLEAGTEFPSNIRPKVWESFKQKNMMSAFLGIVRELRAYGMLKIIKTPPEE